MIEEIKIGKDEMLDVCLKLKESCDFLAFVTAVDYPERGLLELVYNLRSLTDNKNVILKVELPRENPEISSVAVVWPAAEWHEREIFDLFGVKFSGHPDLRRILLPEDWQGHPLLKDYVKPGVIKRPETIK